MRSAFLSLLGSVSSRREIDQYLAQGITIQYLFFPRAGKGSESYDKAVSVWCAKDRNTALTEAKKGNMDESDGS